jgi:hypothetical protein
MKKSIESRLIDFVLANGPTRRRDIIKYLRETIQGRAYDPISDRGYYACAFGGFNNYLSRPTKGDRRYLKRIGHGLYVAADPLQ